MNEQIERRYWASVMRRVLRQQATDSSNDSVARAIFAAGLLRKRLWPAFCITLTERGREFLREADAS